MNNKIGWLMGVALSLIVVWVATSWYASEQFLSIGVRDYVEADETELLASLNIDGLVRESVAISNSEVLLAGSFFPHPSSSTCAVILLPGIGGDRTQVLPILPMFRELNCHVLAYDPRGTGASTRTPRTFGYFEKTDNAVAVRWLMDRTQLPAHAIGIWGPSFGAAVGLLTLDEVDPLGFVIADSTFDTFDRVAHDTISLLAGSLIADLITPATLLLLEARTGMQTDRVTPIDAVVNTTTPILLIHALADPAMHVSHSQNIKATGAGNVALEITDWGAGHANSALVDPVQYTDLVRRFLVGRIPAQTP